MWSACGVPSPPPPATPRCRPLGLFFPTADLVEFSRLKAGPGGRRSLDEWGSIHLARCRCFGLWTPVEAVGSTWTPLRRPVSKVTHPPTPQVSMACCHSPVTHGAAQQADVAPQSTAWSSMNGQKIGPAAGPEPACGVAVDCSHRCLVDIVWSGVSDGLHILRSLRPKTPTCGLSVDQCEGCCLLDTSAGAPKANNACGLSVGRMCVFLGSAPSSAHSEHAWSTGVSVPSEGTDALPANPSSPHVNQRWQRLCFELSCDGTDTGKR